MLFELRNYVQEHKKVSILQIAEHFGLPAADIQHMMRHWVQKGCISICRKESACGTQCRACPMADVFWYLWEENA